MKKIDTLANELFFSDASTHLFEKCRRINKDFPKNILGLYIQKLDACNIKVRFAARALVFIKQIVEEFEHGKFIYFDDANRLKLSFYTESYLIFIRASLDIIVGAYYIYLTGKTNLDSLNDFFKKIRNDNSFLPDSSKEFWESIWGDYEGIYTWINLIVGKEKGLSLRDMVVHKSTVDIDYYIDENKRGEFYIGFSKKSSGNMMPWLEDIFNQSGTIIDRIKNDIIYLDSNIAKKELTSELVLKTINDLNKKGLKPTYERITMLLKASPDEIGAILFYLNSEGKVSWTGEPSMLSSNDKINIIKH